MTCEYREPPQETPCFSTATHYATRQKLAVPWSAIAVCEDHAQVLREQGWDVWPIDRHIYPD